jgi:hypothetical protein
MTRRPPEVHPRLGRIPSPDERDKRFLMRALIPKKLARPTSKYWSSRWVGDQGDTSQCVGYGWHGFLRASPVNTREPKPEVIYDGAQANDEFPGTNYDGTSVRGGAKYLTDVVKQVKEYRWAFSINAVLDWLGTNGPVVLGVDWRSTMFDVDSHGFLDTSGKSEGGHCILAIGYDDKRKALRLVNSWGHGWADNGRCWIRYADADALIREGGEACTAIESAK